MLSLKRCGANTVAEARPRPNNRVKLTRSLASLGRSQLTLTFDLQATVPVEELPSLRLLLEKEEVLRRAAGEIEDEEEGPGAEMDPQLGTALRMPQRNAAAYSWLANLRSWSAFFKVMYPRFRAQAATAPLTAAPAA